MRYDPRFSDAEGAGLKEISYFPMATELRGVGGGI